MSSVPPPPPPHDPGGDSPWPSQPPPPPPFQQPPYQQPPPYQQAPYQYQYGQPPRSTNGLAIASMVLGILWIYWIGSILALVFGYVARSQIRQRGEAGNGMAIAGIVLGWIGVAMLVVVIIIAVVLANEEPESFNFERLLLTAAAG